MVNGDVFYVHDTGGDTACLCNLIPGSYNVSETPPFGWNLTSITPPQPVTVEAGTECGIDAVEVTVNNTLLIPHTTMLEITYVYDSASGNVTMNLTDCNDGEVPITDAKMHLRANNDTYWFSPMDHTSQYFAGGDDNTNDVLDPGECWTWVVNVTINGTTFFEAWGDGIDPLGNHVTYDPDTGEGYESEYQSFEIVSCWGDETAWAYGGGYAKENWDYLDSNNWGWTNGPLSEGSYVFDLYAGAGQNDWLNKGTLVGNVTVDYAGGCVNVTYSVDPGYYLGETHLWVGDDVLPEGKKTPYTNAPGQFPHGVDYGFNSTDPGTWETEWSWSSCDSSITFDGDIYVAAHGVVWMEVECEEERLSQTIVPGTITGSVTDAMWIDSISFAEKGKNLFIEVGVVTASGGLSGAEVSLSLECNNGGTWNFSGTTDDVGSVRFKLGKAPVANYLTAVNSLTCSGFVWDMSKGISSASYALSG